MFSKLCKLNLVILTSFLIIKFSISEILKVKNLYKSFNILDWKRQPKVKNAFDNLSVEFDSSSINVLIGFSGAGKSTFLKLITGIYEPSKGEIVRSYPDSLENSIILDQHFYMSYNLDSSLEEILNSLPDKSKLGMFVF